ncbi:hypothetical protein [Nocardia terpenica]|uniref:Acyl carrier protein n=1 Tax=Nocardia terpenica TaxID=455432 RepID=A0A164L0Z0_9NOCA|nr:hypothetical protein [Nocardia terpenica]KZM71907.1 acyl carrier protein [Nocardia terpenica]NQE86529.1 acyl carrier protein [Nocardia terpenica]
MNIGNSDVPVRADEAAVCAEIAAMIRDVLDDYDLEDLEIGMDTAFGEDLEFESIDMVALGESLDARYGHAVNFAEFVADMELDQIINLTVGQLVEHVTTCLRAAEGADR